MIWSQFPTKVSVKAKDETRPIVQLIHLKWWTRHFEHEYIIKLFKDLVLHQLNTMLNSDHRFALFRQTQTQTAKVDTNRASNRVSYPPCVPAQPGQKLYLYHGI